MEQRRSPVVEVQEEKMERGLTSKRFTDTQAPLLLQDGTTPLWFQGYISRKEAEDLVKDKPVGCFLIRLSDKGYILSYRGQDRCRHFVITQDKAGQFVVSGDTETHHSLANLIEYYKTCPIEPFGEKLTTSCFQTPGSEVYDLVQVDLKNKPSVSVKAVMEMWSNHTSDRTSNRSLERAPTRNPPYVPDRTPNYAPDRAPDCTPCHNRPPALPPKTCNRRAAPMTSYDINTPPEILPRQPRGGAVLRNSLSATPCAQLVHDKSKTQPLPGVQPSAHEMKPRGDVVPTMTTVYSELALETFRSLSLPLLDNNPGPKHSYRQTSFNPPKPSSSPGKRVTCQTYSLLDRREHSRQPPVQSLPSSSSLDKLNINPLYQTAWEDCRWGSNSYGPGLMEPRNPCVAQQDQDTYDQVPLEHPPVNSTNDNTYELIPDQCLRDGSHSNTYETLNDLQPKQSSWGIKADKWRRFFPENKKK